MGKVAASGKEITKRLYPSGRPETEQYADRCAENQRRLAAAQHRSLVVVEEIKPRTEPRPAPPKKTKRQMESDRTRAKWLAARAAQEKNI